MAASSDRQQVSKLVGRLLVANFSFWIYFAVAFVHESYPFKVDPLGHPAGAGYTFFGHSIGIVENPYSHAFFRIMAFIEFPAFLAVGLCRKYLLSSLTGYEFFAGISEGGWRLLAIALLSFVQWYVVGLLAQHVWIKLSSSRSR